MRKELGDLLGRLGLGLGSPFNGAMVYDLKGFRPLPVLKNLKGMDYEWQVCFPWYLERIKGNKILDTGFMEHIGFTKLLVDLGFEVWGIDIKAKVTEGIRAVQAPVWDIERLCPEARFDTIVVNSLLEHLHLPYYTDKDFPMAREVTMGALEQVLSKDGVLLLQVPFGHNPVRVRNKGKYFYEVFTEESLGWLLNEFEIEELDFLIKTREGWQKASRDIAVRVETGGSLPRCLALVKARKKDE